MSGTTGAVAAKSGNSELFFAYDTRSARAASGPDGSQTPGCASLCGPKRAGAGHLRTGWRGSDFGAIPLALAKARVFPGTLPRLPNATNNPGMTNDIEVTNDTYAAPPGDWQAAIRTLAE